MMLLIDSDIVRSRRLSDLLIQERIYPIDPSKEGDDVPRIVLEKVLKHKKDISLIIAPLPSVYSIFTGSNFVTKTAYKLNLDLPCFLAFYTDKEEQHSQFKKVKKECENHKCSFVKYDENDREFPEKYIKEIKGIYNSLGITLRADIDKATRIWTGQEIVLTDQSAKEIAELAQKVEIPEEIRDITSILSDENKSPEKTQEPKDAETKKEIDYKELSLQLIRENQKLKKEIKAYQEKEIKETQGIFEFDASKYVRKEDHEAVVKERDELRKELKDLGDLLK